MYSDTTNTKKISLKQEKDDFSKRYDPEFVEFLGELQDLTILDLGCADCVAIPYYAKVAERRNAVIQLDSRLESIQNLIEIYAESGYLSKQMQKELEPGQIKIIQGEFPYHCPLKENTVDMVVLSAFGMGRLGPFENIFSNYIMGSNTFRLELQRILKPHGKLVLAERGIGTTTRFFDDKIGEKDSRLEYAGKNNKLVQNMIEEGFFLDQIIGDWVAVLRYTPSDLD